MLVAQLDLAALQFKQEKVSLKQSWKLAAKELHHNAECLCQESQDVFERLYQLDDERTNKEPHEEKEHGAHHVSPNEVVGCKTVILSERVAA